MALDKKTFKAYRQVKHPELTPLFSNNIKRQRSVGTDLDYARIAMQGDDHACPMMSNGLCSVQVNLGESYLSNTCFDYPRITQHLVGQIQQTLLLSCPEAARQALLAPDAFDFIEDKITLRSHAFVPAPTRHGLSPDLSAELRIFCIQLMRTAGLELWQRLALLGVFCEMLTQTLKEQRQNDIPTLVSDFTKLVENGGALAALEDLQPNHAAQALVFARLWASKHGVGRSEIQRSTIAMIIRQLGADAETGVASEEDLVLAYRSGVRRLPLALEAAPHLLDHYVLNEMVMNLFPFQDSDPYGDYLKLISRYGLLRLMLVAQCNTSEPLPSPLELVRTVQVYCRRFQHDASFASEANGALHDSEWCSLDRLYAFLRH